MKAQMKIYVIPILSIFSLFFLQACSKDDENGPTPYFQVDGNGHSRFDGKALQATIGSMELEDLSPEELSGILFMREEEKLAHDVYSQLYELWENQAMRNIADSELTHTEAVLQLINRYQLEDPARDNGPGIYENTTLQQLYFELYATGKNSEVDALRVGGAIEEIDILDLQFQIDSVVDNRDVLIVYHNLLKGSRNHLRAFVKKLYNQGIDYTPKYLSVEVFNAIIERNMEKGSTGI